MPETVNPLDAADLRHRVQAVVDQVLAHEQVALARVSEDLGPMIDALAALLAGGKRLRPAFCYWGWRGAGGPAESDDAALRAAASLEFLQACALIHDDVMDGSDTRRGLPSAHRRFAGVHRGAEWLGSPESFGVGAAILLGDLCLVWADEVLLSTDFPVQSLRRAKTVYDDMRTELMAGQYLDLLEQARGGGSVERALTVVRFKSAKYTIERPLHLGAVLAGADAALIAAYSAYGLPLGEAFQLRDDILGVFGDPNETGKPAGDDLREGKADRPHGPNRRVEHRTAGGVHPAAPGRPRPRRRRRRDLARDHQRHRRIGLHREPHCRPARAGARGIAVRGGRASRRRGPRRPRDRGHAQDRLMRTVTGPTDHVVIVGAGLAGLSAAMRLSGAGRRVTVLERESIPGGRAGRLDIDTPNGAYRFDTGPTVLTMPDLIADAFDSVGEDLGDWVTLEPVDPLYRAFFPDGSILDVHADVNRMAEEIESVIGPREADGYRRYVSFVSTLYRYEMADFIDRNIDSPLDLLTPSLVRLAAIGGFRRLASKVREFMKDPRTERVFSFQSMYAGLSPFDALALYAVISYMDSVAGVVFPKGGMHAVPTAMAAAAEKHGVEFGFDTEVASIELDGTRAVAVRTTTGERIPADVVVLNPDLPIAYRDLLGLEPRSVRRLHYSPSCFLMLVGSTAAYTRTAHHNIHFGRAWRGVFDELIDQRRLMSDPSLLVTNPTYSDPSLAPAGRESYYVLVPTPNLDSDIDWRTERARYRDEIVRTLESRGYIGFGNAIEVEAITTPADWRERGMERGAPFASAHSFLQTGPFRPGNLWGENVVFAGSGTRPGVGVPMVLISGRLAAERVTGKDHSYRSRAGHR